MVTAMRTRETSQRTVESDACSASCLELERRFGEGASTVVRALREAGVPLERVLKLYERQANASDEGR